MTEPREIELGEKYRDCVTGFVGVATARAEYLASTPQVRLEAETGSGDAKERWFNEGRVLPEQTPPPGPGFR